MLLAVLLSYYKLNKFPYLMVSYLIENDRDSHHVALNSSREKHNIFPWLDYFWNLIKRALQNAKKYLEFQKTIEENMKNVLGNISKAEVLVEALMISSHWEISSLSGWLDESEEYLLSEIKKLVSIGMVRIEDQKVIRRVVPFHPLGI